MNPISRQRRLQRALLSSTLAVILLGGGIVSGGAGAAVALAVDASSDIPGIQLPGPVAAGRLGGAIYDVVYRLVVAPGYVIVASLTGAPGTDFDLYLYDGSATTVVSNAGLLKKSVGPTSTESIAWPSRFGGIYYIDLNGATDVEGDYRLTVQTVPDPTPPVVAVSLAGGRASTNQLTVPVTLTASDDLSGVTEMAFSSDGSAYTDWQPFDRWATWTFGPGDGVKTLWAKVRNGVGLESAPATAKVTIDTVPPSAIAIQPAPGSSVVGLRPSFTVTFDEPIDAQTWFDLGLVVQAASGGLVPGDYSYNLVTSTGTFVPSLALSPGGTYIVTIGDVRDLAGNRIAAGGSWTVTSLAPVTLAVTGPTVVSYGASARLDVSLLGAPDPAYVTVVGRRAGAAESVPVANLTMVGGSGSVTVRPEANTTYRAAYQGPPAVASATVDRAVLVRRLVVLAGPSPSVLRTARRGASVALAASITPATGSIALTFKLYRYDSIARAYRYVRSFARATDALGTARLTWGATTVGSFYWRVVVPSTVDYANNTSGSYRWTIRP